MSEARTDEPSAEKALKKKLKRERQKAGKAEESATDAAPEPEPEAAAAEQPPRDEAAAKKKAEANRKKRERAKAKKREAAAAAAGVDPAMVRCAERRDAGEGRGQGMFCTEARAKGEPIVRIRPALSVVFDAQAPLVCGFCFSALAAADVQPCTKCSRFAVCGACRDLGYDEWHRHECEAFCNLPAGARKGKDTSTIRMLLRHKATAEHGEWCGASAAAAGKEDLGLLKTLQANPTDVPPQLLGQLSMLTGVERSTVEELVYQIRTNAATLERGGKAGCALCCHMGFTNHDCDPNAQAVIDSDGYVTLTALRPIQVDEEVSISYIDNRQGLDERRQILDQHYGFSCSCAKCKADLRKKLRGGTRDKRAQGTGRGMQ